MTAYGGGAIELRFQRKRMTFFIWNENRWRLLNNFSAYLFYIVIVFFENVSIKKDLKKRLLNNY